MRPSSSEHGATSPVRKQITPNGNSKLHAAASLQIGSELYLEEDQ